VDFNNPTGNKLFTLTDVTPEEIFGLPTILILGKWFKSKIVDDWVEKFLLLRQSRFRLGRREFMMTATGIREAGEAKKKEKLTNVFAGLKLVIPFIPMGFSPLFLLAFASLCVITAICQYCKSGYERKPSQIGKYCSSDCFGKDKTKKAVERLESVKDSIIKDNETMSREKLCRKYKTYPEILKKIISFRDRSSGKVKVNLSPSKSLWYIIGVLFGDGYVYTYKHHQCKNSTFNRLELNVKDRDFANKFMRCCKDIGLHPFLTTKKSVTTRQGFLWKVYANSKTFVDWFRKMKSEDILNLPDELKVPFISGFFDSEGNVYKGNAKMTNTDLEKIALIRSLLTSIGYKTSLYYSEGGFCSHYDIWMLGGKEKVREFLLTIQPSILRKQI
jgi:intein-encoded DNA endonuclease-like protein